MWGTPARGIGQHTLGFCLLDTSSLPPSSWCTSYVPKFPSASSRGNPKFEDYSFFEILQFHLFKNLVTYTFSSKGFQCFPLFYKKKVASFRMPQKGQSGLRLRLELSLFWPVCFSKIAFLLWSLLLCFYSSPVHLRLTGNVNQSELPDCLCHTYHHCICSFFFT